MVNFEAALQEIAGARPLHILRLEEPTIEIDFPEDFERARDEILPRIEALESTASP